MTTLRITPKRDQGCIVAAMYVADSCDGRAQVVCSSPSITVDVQSFVRLGTECNEPVRWQCRTCLANSQNTASDGTLLHGHRVRSRCPCLSWPSGCAYRAEQACNAVRTARASSVSGIMPTVSECRLLYPVKHPVGWGAIEGLGPAFGNAPATKISPPLDIAP